MSHGHGHHHHHNAEKLSDGRLILAIGVNMLLTAAQVAGGIVSGSLSLLADALHNFNDAGSLLIALIARRIARRPADNIHTYGHRRAEIIGALINTTTLIIIGLYLVVEAAKRIYSREPIDGWIVVWVAGIAFIVDVITALLTYSMAKNNLNMKAAFQHNLSDALASIGVMIAGTLIILYEWYFTDLIATLVISLYILWQGAWLMKSTTRILMESIPESIDATKLRAAIEAIDGVEEIHDFHVWQMDEHLTSMEAHVVIDEHDLNRMEVIKVAIKDMIEREFGIQHSTLEFETPQQLHKVEHDHHLQQH